LRGQYRDPQLDKVIFETFATRWADGLTRKAKTRQGYEALLNNHLIPAFGSWPLVAIGQPDVQQFVSTMSARGYGATTVRNAYAVLRPVMKIAVVAGVMPWSPCIEIELPTGPTVEIDCLSAEQVNALAAAITPQFRLLIIFAAYTGLRAGELAALRWRRVDLLAGKVEVAESVADIGGKFVYGTTKTGKVRTVPLPRFLSRALGESLATGIVPHPNSSVFTSTTGRPLRHNLFFSGTSSPRLRAPGCLQTFGSMTYATRMRPFSSLKTRTRRRSRSAWGTAPYR
jgi:integrase